LALKLQERALAGCYMKKSVLVVPILLVMVGFLNSGFLSPVYASPINYNETVNGDLAFDRSGVPLTTLALGEGVNTVSGAETLNGLIPNDNDGFFFTLASGLRLDSIIMTFSFAQALTPTAGDEYCQQWRLLSPTSVVLGERTPDPFGKGCLGPPALAPAILSGSAIFASALPLSTAGPFQISGNGGYVKFNGGGTLNYTFTFNVANTNAVTPAPEPDTLTMLVLGIAGLGALRLRRRCS